MKELPKNAIASKDALFEYINNPKTPIVEILNLIRTIELTAGLFKELNYTYKAIELLDQIERRIKASNRITEMEKYALSGKIFSLGTQLHDLHHAPSESISQE